MNEWMDTGRYVITMNGWSSGRYVITMNGWSSGRYVITMNGWSSGRYVITMNGWSSGRYVITMNGCSNAKLIEFTIIPASVVISSMARGVSSGRLTPTIVSMVTVNK